MAVAVADDTTGAAEKNPLVRGPFVITPSVPVLAAPGDEFEVGVTVAIMSKAPAKRGRADSRGSFRASAKS